MKQKILDELSIERCRYFKVNQDSDDNILHIILNDRKGSSSFKVGELLQMKEKLEKYQNQFDIKVSLEEIIIKL
jgi:hypothetical protein